MKKRTKKISLIAAGVIVVVIVAIMNFTGSNGEGTEVQAELAYLGEISEIVNASGRVQPQTRVDITSEVPAEIIAVFVSDGQQVEKGQRLLLLDTVQTKSDVAQARYSLDEITARTQAARSQYDRDKKEFERQSSLFEQKLSSETEYANAKFAYENSEANYDAMQAQMKTGRALLDKAEDNLSKTLITAPMDGVITYLNAEVGEIAQAQTSFTQGKTLLTIADLSVFEVEVDVDETEVAMVKEGHQAGIRVDAFTDSVFEGTVIEVGNSATISGEGSDSYTTSFRVKVRFIGTQAPLRPGMSASVDITTNKEDEALLVPYAAIVEREFDADSLRADSAAVDDSTLRSGELHAAEAGDTETAAGDTPESSKATDGKYRKKEKIKKSGIFIVKNGKAEFIEVATGIADDRNIAALTGLNPGDTVISGSFQTLRKLAVGDDVIIDESSLKKMEEES
jgi:HlyD family secretion protein